MLVDPRNDTFLVVVHLGHICNGVETGVFRTSVSLEKVTNMGVLRQRLF